MRPFGHLPAGFAGHFGPRKLDAGDAKNQKIGNIRKTRAVSENDCLRLFRPLPAGSVRIFWGPEDVALKSSPEIPARAPLALGLLGGGRGLETPARAPPAPGLALGST